VVCSQWWYASVLILDSRVPGQYLEALQREDLDKPLSAKLMC